MAADHFTAALALPRFPLFLEEFLYSVFIDELQVVDQAHLVARLVSFVNGSQSPAWEAFALVTKDGLTFGQFGALFLQKCTVLVSWSAAYAADHSDPFCLEVMFLSQIA